MPMALFLFVPLVALVAGAEPARLLANLGDPAVASAIRISLTTTLVSLALSVVAGTPLAYLLGRRRFRGRGALDTLIDLPMVLPPSVAGIALLLAFGRRGLFGQFLDDAGVSIAFTSVAVVLAQTFVAAPLFVKSAAAGFGEVDRDLEQAAQVDGATGAQTFWHITLPLSRTALITGATMSWARALGEFGATIIFAGNVIGRTQTMPLAIYIGLEGDLSAAVTLSVLLLIVSFGVLFLVKGVLHRRV